VVLICRYINSLNKDETELIGDLVLEVVRRHQRHMVISPWSLIATILMQNRDGISITQLIKESDWLKRQAQNFGAYVDWPGDWESRENSVKLLNLTYSQGWKWNCLQ